MASKVMVITHGTLAQAFKDTVGMVYGAGAEDELVALGLQPEQSPAEFAELVNQALENAYTADGIIIFLDIISGTPFNTVALALHDFVTDHPAVACFAGINLPVLIETFGAKDYRSLDELATGAAEAFPQSFVNLREMLEI